MSAQDKELVRSTAPGSSGMVVPQGHDPVADAWVPIKVAADGTLLVQLSGSMIDLRGLAINRPAANSVSAGTTYWSVDTGTIEVSNGTDWVVV